MPVVIGALGTIKEGLDQYFQLPGYAVAHLVEALRYKPEGRGFYSRWCRNFSLTSFCPHCGPGVD